MDAVWNRECIRDCQAKRSPLPQRSKGFRQSYQFLLCTQRRVLFSWQRSHSHATSRGNYKQTFWHEFELVLCIFGLNSQRKDICSERPIKFFCFSCCKLNFNTHLENQINFQFSNFNERSFFMGQLEGVIKGVILNVGIV